MSLPKISFSFSNHFSNDNLSNNLYSVQKMKKTLNKSIGIGTNEDENDIIYELENEKPKETISTIELNPPIINPSIIKSKISLKIPNYKINTNIQTNIQNTLMKSNKFFLKKNDKLKGQSNSIIKISPNRLFSNNQRNKINNIKFKIKLPMSKNKKNKSYFKEINTLNKNTLEMPLFMKKILNKEELVIPNEKPNILNNKFIKSHFSFRPRNVSVRHNYINFNNEENKKIVSDDKSLIGSLVNQTNSNFNNKYKIQYWSNNNKKREQIKYCFNLIKNGTNLSSIDYMLNGPKEITFYEIPSLNLTYEDDNFLSKKIKLKGKTVTINNLEHIRPITSNTNRIQKIND